MAILLREAPSRLNDIRESGGTTVLDFAVQRGHFEIAQILIAAGADPDQQFDDGISTRMLESIHNLRTGNFSSEACRLLGIQDFLNETDIPEISRTVLRLPGCCQMERLVQRWNRSKFVAEAMKQDIFGYTALHWACTRGDVEAVTMLLDMGAEVNARSVGGATPLYLAAFATQNATACIVLLRRAGAKLTIAGDGCGPLHLACGAGTKEAVAELVRMGAALEARSNDGYGVFEYAIRYDNVNVLEWLLDNSAVDIDNAWAGSSTMLPMLLFAIALHASRCVQSLLLRGARYHFWTGQGTMTALHEAARYSDVHMLEILARHGMAGLDIHARYEGCTAQDFFDEREGKSDELKAAFKRLLSAVERANAVLAQEKRSREEESGNAARINDTDSENEVFCDAKES